MLSILKKYGSLETGYESYGIFFSQIFDKPTVLESEDSFFIEGKRF